MDQGGGQAVRKQRTRSHIIAEMSANYFERYALRCGYAVQRIEHDYGIDLLLHTFDENGRIENDSVKIQLKATDQLRLLQDQETIAFSIETADLDHWLREPMPVILVVYDVQADLAYWLYVQAYFAQRSERGLATMGNTTVVHLRKADVLNEHAIREFARYKQNVLSRMAEVIHERE
jgi:hypothetical protein